jgi:hypothetical protein
MEEEEKEAEAESEEKATEGSSFSSFEEQPS